MQNSDFLETLPFPILVVARDRQKGEILFMNSGFRTLLNASAGLHYLADIWLDDDGNAVLKEIQKNAPAHHLTVTIGTKWYRLNIHEVLWEEKIARMIWATDISDAQDALKAADIAAEAKANFLATMSHEMRTPMQSVYGLLELIALEKPSPQILEMVNIARSSAAGLLEILDDILDLAKMDADKMELDQFEVPIRTLARGVLEALSVKAHGKPVTLKDDIDQDVPFVVIGDPKRLRQILINLTGNALKFTQEGSVTLRVMRTTQHLAQRDIGINLRFEIKDTGIGMSPEVCSKLFQAFTQADNSTARKFGGTGLGLSICKKLVELMGGVIGVDSIEGHGSTFWFEIPTEEIAVNAKIIDMPDLSGITVLSVEDHPQGAKEIANSLKSMGAAVDSCASFAEGLDLVKRKPYDVGVIDQGLPDGLGLDLIRHIMDIRPFMGLLMYTVRDDVGLQHSLQSLGVTYIAKPASRLGLGQAVLEAASKSHHITSDSPKRLLIAEDTLSVQDLLRRQLKSLNVEADFVGNGKEALHALESGKYGILFTDLHMPDMDGYALIEMIRHHEKETQKHLPVVVLTADVQMAQRQVYLSHGFDECLLKPISLGHFRRLLIRWGLLTSEETVTDIPQSSIPSSTQSSAPIDRAAIVTQMGAFDQDAIEMLGFFIEMTKPVIARLVKGLETQNVHDVKEAAHSLKGAARSACAFTLGDLAGVVQDEAEKNMIDNATIQKILAEFPRVEDDIKSMKVP